MSRVFIVVDAEVDGVELGQAQDLPLHKIAASSTISRMVSALKDAIASASVTVQVIEANTLTEASNLHPISATVTPEDILWCPLTLNIPNSLDFPGQDVYQACRNIPDLRQWVEQTQGITPGAGNFWLPVILTAKGLLYAEVIGLAAEVSAKEISEDLLQLSSNPYQQPVHLSDLWRQSLYQLAHRLLKYLSAPPSVYLLQFGFKEQSIVFDRLLPFPAAPAIASLGIQTPDLFTCHWYCLTKLPIFDLKIGSASVDS